MRQSPVCRPVALSCLALALAGCAAPAPRSGAATGQPPAQERSCVRGAHVPGLPAVASRGDPTRHRAPAGPASLPFSKTSVDTGKAIGVYPELVTIATAKEAGLPFEQVMIARQVLMERIMLTMLEAASVTGEIDCENERSAQLRDRLQKMEEQRLRSLTVAGLVLGAATAIVSGGIALYSPEAAAANVVNVVGGTAQAGTGFATLSNAPTGELRHDRNLLADLWHGKPESDLYPASVWRFLNDVEDDQSGTLLRQRLIAQWKAEDRLGPAGSEEEQRRAALIFGEGGVYTIDDLQTRDAILDQLEATVKLLYQDLARLLRELADWTAANR